MNTLLLSQPGADPFTSPGWDLSLDSSGNIAIATGDYAIAQDVASACRTFIGEVWYNTGLGIPYFQQILGFIPSLPFLKTQYIAAAGTVPGVGSIQVFLTGPGTNREVGGQIQVTNSQGIVVGSIDTTNLQGIAPWYVNAAIDGAYSA